MKLKIFILFLLFFNILSQKAVLSQTQAEIEQMFSGDDEKAEKTKKTKKTKIKTELSKRAKKIDEEEKKVKKAKLELEKEEVKALKLKNEKEKELLKEAKKLAKKNKQKKNDPLKLDKGATSEKVIVLKKTKKVKKNKKQKKRTIKAGENNIDKLNFSQSKKIGDKLSKQGSFYNAIDYFKQSLFKAKNDKQKVEVYRKLADANYFLRDYKLAELNYKRAIELNTNYKKYPLLDFQLANTYKYLAKYDSSIVVYKRFLKREIENKDLTGALRFARQAIKGSEFALEYINADPKFKIENAGENVNAAFTDYGPEIVDNRLYFSKINSDVVIVLDENLTEKDFSKIYYSEINEDKIAMFQDFAENINTDNIHVGNPSFSKDGRFVYYTKCGLDVNMQSQCRIFRSERINNVWQEGELLNSNINFANSSTTQPQIVMLNSEEQILYFVSDRENGKGAKDIWYVYIDAEGNYTKAKNAGYPINTKGDDISPFYVSDSKTLYFSSNGHISFGGLDVFKITKNAENEWTEDGVTNMGLPVNSSLDDYDFVLNKNENRGFLVSNRVGTTTLKGETCCDDIFEVKPTAIDIYVTGKVFVENKTNRSILEDADLFLYNANTNQQISSIDYKNGIAFIEKVEQNVTYKIVAINEKFENGEISFSTENIFKSDTIQYDIFMKNKDMTGLVLSKVYYEFNVSKLRSDAPDSLRKVVTFLEAYPDVILEVGSHTDSKGSDKYNYALAERRSLSVKNYLIYQKNIPENRLVNKSYGESSPAAPNKNADGSDNPEGRDLNRRTEFKIIGYLNKDDK